MLSDNPKSKELNPKRRSVDAPTNIRWSDKQKLEAVQSYLLLGNLALTSRILSIPEITLRVWKASEWWRVAVEEVKMQENMEMSSRLKKIVDASLGAVEDRLANGDWVYDQKSGEMRRKHVNLKDAHKVAVDLMDKKDLLEKKSGPVQAEEQDDERLLKLAEKFANFVTQKTQKEILPVVEDISDVEPKEESDAIHEERQA
jgi:hypothetical protein